MREGRKAATLLNKENPYPSKARGAVPRAPRPIQHFSISASTSRSHLFTARDAKTGPSYNLRESYPQRKDLHEEHRRTPQPHHRPHPQPSRDHARAAHRQDRHQPVRRLLRRLRNARRLRQRIRIGPQGVRRNGRENQRHADRRHRYLRQSRNGRCLRRSDQHADRLVVLRHGRAGLGLRPGST